ncbi:hypothetical protein C8R43DRAFT_953374 [Mycena crocata]|nr:hypothetical protein C8R43DRAFT_953374 [Mycena crocata]
MNRLAVELVGHILRHLVEEAVELEPFAIERWFAIVMNNPHLWTNVFIDNYPPTVLLSDILERSKSLKIHVYLQIHTFGLIPPDQREYARPFDFVLAVESMLRPHFDRWTGLTLCTHDTRGSLAVARLLRQITPPSLLDIRLDMAFMRLSSVAELEEWDAVRDSCLGRVERLTIKHQWISPPTSTILASLTELRLEHIRVPLEDLRALGANCPNVGSIALVNVSSTSRHTAERCNFRGVRRIYFEGYGVESW